MWRGGGLYMYIESKGGGVGGTYILKVRVEGWGLIY